MKSLDIDTASAKLNSANLNADNSRRVTIEFTGGMQSGRMYRGNLQTVTVPYSSFATKLKAIQKLGGKIVNVSIHKFQLSYPAISSQISIIEPVYEVQEIIAETDPVVISVEVPEAISELETTTVSLEPEVVTELTPKIIADLVSESVEGNLEPIVVTEDVAEVTSVSEIEPIAISLEPEVVTEVEAVLETAQVEISETVSEVLAEPISEVQEIIAETAPIVISVEVPEAISELETTAVSLEPEVITEETPEVVTVETPEIVADLESESVNVNLEPIALAEVISEPELVAVAEEVSEAISEPEPVAVVEEVSEAISEPEPLSKEVPEVISESLPVAISEAISEPEPIAEEVPEVISESESVAVTEEVFEVIPETEKEPIAEVSSEITFEPEFVAVTEEVFEVIPETETELVPEISPEIISEPESVAVDEVISEVISELESVSVDEEVSKKISELEPVAETEEVSEVISEVISEPEPVAETEEVSEVISEVISEPEPETVNFEPEVINEVASDLELPVTIPTTQKKKIATETAVKVKKPRATAKSSQGFSKTGKTPEPEHVNNVKAIAPANSKAESIFGEEVSAYINIDIPESPIVVTEDIQESIAQESITTPEALVLENSVPEALVNEVVSTPVTATTSRKKKAAIATEVKPLKAKSSDKSTEGIDKNGKHQEEIDTHIDIVIPETPIELISVDSILQALTESQSVTIEPEIPEIPEIEVKHEDVVTTELISEVAVAPEIDLQEVPELDLAALEESVPLAPSIEIEPEVSVVKTKASTKSGGGFNKKKSKG